MRKRLNNIFFIVGLTAVIIMLCTFDVSFVQLWQSICQAGYWLIAILGLWLLLYTLNALAWRIILKESGPCNVNLKTLLRLTIAGFALNYSTPVGLIGGEAFRIMELTNHVGVNRASSSVILFAMMHIFSHFWFWITAIITYIILALIGNLPLTTPIIILLSLITAFCTFAIYFFVKGYRNGLVIRTIRLLGKIPGLHKRLNRFLQKNNENLQKIDRQIAQLQQQSKRAFYGSFLLEYFGRILQCLEIYFMLLLFGENNGGGLEGHLLTFLHSFLILAFTSLFANMLGFLPLQLGGREGGFAMSVIQMGMTNEIAMFVSIICRARELFWTFLGLMLIKLHLPDKPIPPKTTP